MISPEYSRALQADRDLIEFAVRERDEREARRAVRSLLSHLDAADTVEVLEVSVKMAAAVFSDACPSLAWTKAVPGGLYCADSRRAMWEIIGRDSSKGHYYAAITHFISAIDTALGVAASSSLPETGLATDAVLGLMEALRDISWSFRDPDTYALWWASDNWARFEEGPSPTYPELQIADADFDQVGNLLIAIKAWIDTKCAGQVGEARGDEGGR